MKVTWKVEGAENWSSTIVDDISCPPIEIATKVIERELKKSYNQDAVVFGLILMVTHDKMKSVDETFICHMPTVLANAGFHFESVQLQKQIDKLLKH
jgi:predicted PP-loop superfamily ATPase